MFQTNPPEFDSVPENPSTDSDTRGNPNRLNKADQKKKSTSSPQFATLEAFSYWMDLQLAKLESEHEGFATVTSVRGYFGR